MASIRLSKPIAIGEGDAKKTLEEIDLRLDALTGGDVEFCVREAAGATGIPILLYEYDLEFFSQVIVKQTGISRQALRDIPARDYRKLAQAVRAFFVDQD